MAYEIKSMSTEQFDEFLEFEPAPEEVEHRLALISKVMLHEAYRLVALKGKRTNLITQRDRNSFGMKQRRAAVTMDLAAKKQAGDKSLTEGVISALVDGDPDLAALHDQDIVLDTQVASCDRAISIQEYRIAALQMLHKSLLALADSMLTERINSR